MPLGLMSGMVYEEHDTRLAPGDTLLLHSDGLAEAHNEDGEMFGFPRLQRLVAHHRAETMIAGLLAELDRFISCELDDDITLLTPPGPRPPVASQERVVGQPGHLLGPRVGGSACSRSGTRQAGQEPGVARRPHTF
jgi:Stage II sporulation protein E (SpoIIE)